MYKLMLVDDESLSRYVLRTLILKKFDNIEIVCEAENGRQAIEMNRKFQPEIIIMDIKMPGINGIDAAVEIIGEFPNVNILILTAYNNFDYIKSALDIGVKGYILKPVKEEETVEKINKILVHIEEKSNRYEFKEVIEAKIKEVKPFIENELVTAFILGNNDVEKVEKYITFLEEEIKAGYFMLISHGRNNSIEINDFIRKRILMEKTSTIVTRHLPLLKKCFFGKPLGNYLVVFLSADKGLQKTKIVDESLMIAEDIKRKLKVIGDIDAFIGIGNAYCEVGEFYKSYNEALFSLRKAIPDKRVVHYSSLQISNDNCSISSYPMDLENKIIDQLKSGNFENAKNFSVELVENLADRIHQIDALKGALGEFVSVLKRVAYKMGNNLNNIADMGVLSELSELTTIEELKIWGKRCGYNIISRLETYSNQNIDVTTRAMEFTNKNFNKDITLESLAAEVGLSSQYLSRVFKEKYGTNFIDYITKKRLEYAEELLLKGNMNIKEISRMSGYQDSNYFCKLFKKDTGLSPKQFRTKVITGDARW